ncbi:MAG: ABC transporter ATP-binding protein [Burkholderiaceae bacterium]|nr:ABC transporter ATP-binding protein [Burkholderiaceae bacterium]
MSEIVVRAQQVSKVYPIYDRPSDRLLQILWRGRRRYHREFHALDDVSFEVARGRTLGIIGRNGAGKSTLLQIICGTLTPTSGQLEVNGRIAALLELGAGFNPEFSGRDNVRINAAILGLTPAQIDERFDDMLAFADIGDFIDQPVKTYSSGMYVRLAFSVAIHVSPDILVVDEALAVGDAFFQARCMARMKRMLDDGITMLFISHDIAAVKALCTDVLWLERGRVRAWGPTDSVASQYTQDWVVQANRLALDAAAEAAGRRAPAGAFAGDGRAAGAGGTAGAAGAAGAAGTGPAPAIDPACPPVPADHSPRSGDGRARFVAAGWSTPQGPAQHVPVAWGDRLTIRAEIEILAPCEQLIVSYHIKDRHQQHLLGGHTGDSARLYPHHCRPGERLRVRFELPVRLHEGAYSLTLLVAGIGDLSRYTDAVFLDWIDDLMVMRVSARERFPLSDLVELEHDMAVDIVASPQPALVVGDR